MVLDEAKHTELLTRYYWRLDREPLSIRRFPAGYLFQSAIMSDDSESYVYIVGDDNKVVRRPIKLGNVTPNGIVIREGLTGQERVVLRAGGFLNEGETVKPVVEKN